MRQSNKSTIKPPAPKKAKALPVDAAKKPTQEPSAEKQQQTSDQSIEALLKRLPTMAAVAGRGGEGAQVAMQIAIMAQAMRMMHQIDLEHRAAMERIIGDRVAQASRYENSMLRQGYDPYPRTPEGFAPGGDGPDAEVVNGPDDVVDAEVVEEGESYDGPDAEVVNGPDETVDAEVVPDDHDDVMAARRAAHPELFDGPQPGADGPAGLVERFPELYSGGADETAAPQLDARGMDR